MGDLPVFEPALTMGLWARYLILLSPSSVTCKQDGSDTSGSVARKTKRHDRHKTFTLVSGTNINVHSVHLYDVLVVRLLVATLKVWR